MSDIDICLDVDGVFNAFPRSAAPAWGWECEPVNAQVMGLNICHSPSLVRALHSLILEHDLRPHWLTTWCRHAPTLLAPAIGLEGGEWPVLGEDDYTEFATSSAWSRNEWWKFTAMKRHAEENPDRRIIWIDDDLAWDTAALAWAIKNESVLGISPVTSVGLTTEHFRIMERWIVTGDVA